MGYFPLIKSRPVKRNVGVIRAFWTWNPVSSVEFRPFDEPYMLAHNEWLFDKDLWRELFRKMADYGFNGMVFANTHPFPYMIEYERFPEARMLDAAELARYQEIYRWIFREGLSHGIETYLLFFSIYYPDPLLKRLGLHDQEAYSVNDSAIDYTRYCVEQLLMAYPNLGGVIGDASENIKGGRGEFLREAIVRPFERIAAGKKLILRGWCSDFEELRNEVAAQTKVPIIYSVKYTWEHLVHENPDRMFLEWVSSAGAENVMAELWISNFEPLTCFAYSTVEGILANLRNLGCPGFSLHPLSMYEWPLTSDRCWEHQFDRDAAWYCAWGERPEAIPDEQKALVEDEELRAGLEAASETGKLAALYFAGDKQNQWHPQFCSIRHADGVRLLTIEDMCNLGDPHIQALTGTSEAFDSLDWMTQLTGHPTKHFEDLGPAYGRLYGPEEFAADMDSLVDKALSGIATAKGKYRSKGQRCLLRHAAAQALLGRFWAERARAGIAHTELRLSAAVSHMQAALGAFRQLEALEGTHRNPFRVLTGRCAQANGWDTPRRALQAELADYRAGNISGRYYAGKIEHRDSPTTAHGKLEWQKKRKR